MTITHRPRILVVEDDAVLAIGLEGMLVDIGYEVAALAATGLEAIDLALERRPDAVLMDISLRGGMSGIEAARMLNGKLRLPIVYLTAYTDEALLQQAKITDAYAYLNKPIRQRELRASLEMAMYRHDADQRLRNLNRILRARSDLGRLITIEHDPARLLAEACEILHRTGFYRFVWIGELDGSTLKPLAKAGEGGPLIEAIRRTATPEQGQRLPGSTAAVTRQVVACDDLLHDERYAPWREAVILSGLTRTIAVPMIFKGRLFGVLNTYAEEDAKFDEPEATLLEEFAGDIALGLGAIAIDAERARAEQATARLARQNEMILASAGEGIVGINHDGSISFINPAAAGMLGREARAMIGHQSHSVMHHSRVDGRAYPEEDCPTTKALIDGLASRVSDEVFWRQDGTSFPVEYASTPIREDGRITGAVITFLDISERQRHEREVVAIASLSSAMRTATDRAAMLPVVVEQLVSLTLCDAVAIEIVDPSSGDSVVEAGHGQWAGLVGRRQAEGTGINARIAADRQPYLTKDLEHDPEVVYPAEARKGIKGCAALPLVAQEKLIGFIWTGTRSLIEEPVLRLLSTLADIVANAIHRATSHELAIRARAELVVAYDTTLEGWARALELRDRETEGHARRVVDLALSLARRLGVEESEMEGLRRGALLHDIGKMGVPDSVLLKPDTLDEGEWEIMRRHPRHAYDLLAPIAYLRDVAELPYSHHEKWDGSGYPRGLKGEAIPLSARIFAIVDVWDALRSDRPYRAAWPAARTIQLLKEQSGKHFDPRVVEAFVDMVRDGP